VRDRSEKTPRMLWSVLAFFAFLARLSLAQHGFPSTPSQEGARAGRLEQKVGQLESLVEAQHARINSLRAKLDRIEARSDDQIRTAQVRQLVRELIADTGFRQSLYPDIRQVGYDKGFYIRSSDETFLLKVNGFIHVRWTGQNRQTENSRRQGRQRQDDINGFEIEDLRLILTGHIHSPKLTYEITTTADTDQDHEWRTWRAYVTYAFAEEVKVSVGLFKIPFGRQEHAGKAAQQFVDRSLANEVFNLDRAMIAMLHGTFARRLGYAMAISNGFACPRDSPSREQLDTNFAYTARLVGHILGRPITTESDLVWSKDPQLEVGLSFGYSDDNGDRNPSASYSIPDRIRRGRGIGGNAMADLTGTDLYQFGADAAFRYRGLSVTGEYWLRTIDGDSEFSPWEQLTGRADPSHQQGGYVQAGYFIVPKKVEVAARLGGVWDNNGDDVWEYAFGVNYFPWGTYSVLLQADFTRIAEAPMTSSAANWGQNDEINMVRVQLQVKF